MSEAAEQRDRKGKHNNLIWCCSDEVVERGFEKKIRLQASKYSMIKIGIKLSSHGSILRVIAFIAREMNALNLFLLYC